MSWLDSTATSRDDLLGLHPGLAAAHDDVLAEIWNGSVDPRILELCRLRAATLVGNRRAWQAPMSPAAAAAGLDRDLVEALPRWPSDPRFDAATSACLLLAEQFVLDVHGVTDEMVDGVSNHIGPDGVITLTTALAMWEVTNRFDNALLDQPAPEPPTTAEEA